MAAPGTRRRLTRTSGDVTDAAIGRFCDELSERALAALAAGSVERHLHLGGSVVHLQVAGPGLVDILDPALTHAHGPPTDLGPDGIEVWAWDRAATGIAPPSPVWPLQAHLPSGAVRGLTDGPIRVAFDRWQRVLTVDDRRHRRVIVHAADAAAIPHWVVRSPLRTVLTAWAAQRGGAMVHASGVVADGGAVLLAGASGSGKSTTALTAAAAGLGFLGDDACMVTFEPDAVAHAVYGRAKLEPDALERLPVLRHLVVDTDAGSPVLEPVAQLAPSTPLRAVALVDVGAVEGTSIRRIAPADAFRRLVEGARDEGAGTTLRGLKRLAVDVPCVALTVGRDPDRVVDAVRRLAAGDVP